MIDVDALRRLIMGPGIDTRTWTCSATIADGDNSVSVEEDGCFVTVNVPADADDDGNDGVEYLEVTAKFCFPMSGNGGIIFLRPQPGQQVVLHIDSGDPEAGIYATHPINTELNQLPDYVLSSNDLVILPPESNLVVIHDDDPKEAARKDDTIIVNSENILTWITNVELALAALGQPVVSLTGDITGNITSGSSRVKIGD